MIKVDQYNEGVETLDFQCYFDPELKEAYWIWHDTTATDPELRQRVDLPSCEEQCNPDPPFREDLGKKDQGGVITILISFPFVLTFTSIA